VKLLLDEQLPRKLAGFFPDSTRVLTVRKLGWDGISNGKLLARAKEDGFHAVLTADKNLEYQQNPETIPLPVIVLAAQSTKLTDLAPLIPSVMAIMESDLQPGIYRIDSV